MDCRRAASFAVQQSLWARFLFQPCANPILQHEALQAARKRQETADFRQVYESGSQCSTLASGPPIIVVKVFASAPARPPLTGASSTVTPTDAHSSLRRRAFRGVPVPWLTMMLPPRRPASRPLSTISNTSSSVPTHSVTTSHADANVAMVAWRTCDIWPRWSSELARRAYTCNG